MLAAPDIDDHRAPRHHREGAGAEDALGLAGQRQQADRDVGLVQEPLELVGAVEDRDLLVRARRRTQADTGKPSDFSTSAGAFAISPRPRNPMRRCSGRTIGRAQPFAVGLRLLIERHLAVKPQHVHDGVFGHHRVAARRLDLAERHLRQSR